MISRFTTGINEYRVSEKDSKATIVKLKGVGHT